MIAKILLATWLLASLWAIGPLSAAPATVTDIDGAIQPQVAVSSDAVVHVVFGQNDSGKIYHVSSAGSVLAFGQPRQVAALPKLALGKGRGPRVAVSGKSLVVAAISHADGNLYGWTSPDAGTTWSKPQVINDAPGTAAEGLHALASDPRGNVFITWLDSRNKGMQVWGAASADGGLHWGKNLLIYQSPDGSICPCCRPSIAMDDSGRIAVMWRNSLAGARDMHLSLSSDTGKSFAPATKLGEGTWTLDGCPIDGGDLAFNAKGDLLTIWRRDTAIYLTTGSQPEQLLAKDGLRPIIASGKPGPSFLWEANGDLMTSSPSTPAPTPLAQKATHAASASIPGGGSVLVWESQTAGKPALLGELVE